MKSLRIRASVRTNHLPRVTRVGQHCRALSTTPDSDERAETRRVAVLPASLSSLGLKLAPECGAD